MGKIRELDGLRGLLAVWVVCVHLLPSAGIGPKSFGLFAPLFGELIRVQMFCVMSGFVIFLMFDKRRMSYRDFMWGRILRLYPVYILAFVLSVMIADVALTALRDTPFPVPRTGERIMALEGGIRDLWAHIGAHVFLVHGLVPASVLPNAAYAFLGQAWNISTEFQFYVVAPLLFFGFATGPVWRKVAFGVVCLCLVWALRNWPNPADLAQYAGYFGLGVASFAFWKRDWSDPRLLNPLVIMGLSLAVFFGVDLAAGMWICVLGLLALRRDQGRGARAIGWLAAPPLLWLGEVSYALYLLHMIPMYFGMYLLNGAGLGQGAYLAALTLFTFAAGLPLAFAVTTWVERRFYVGLAPSRPLVAANRA